MDWLLIFASVLGLLIVAMVIIGARRSRQRSHLDPSRDVYFGDREPRPPHGPHGANTESSSSSGPF
ncbi:hypothetical protein [Catellatospora citrea]|uniref:Uncharacterized protein n=1 Tax=Catellatospora citrea TaxID=53366 RepID=A0A8J3KFD4_9ACTN|nr:hypothetical protein [Catellatospora citrea]RKE12614.1 putative secreted protein with PEP-CTERM sorting signal [Catellatospora citrea]GIF96150.1 hypothetical protein Cci01nite_12440 [Catellatospora citrea]